MIGRSFADLTDAFIWVGRFNEATETARCGLVHLENEISANRVRLVPALGQASAASVGASRLLRRCGKLWTLLTGYPIHSLRPECSVLGQP